MTILMKYLWEIKRFFTLCQSSLLSSRASSIKQCSKTSQLLNESGSARKNTYERVIFNFNCTVSKFYCTYFSKVFLEQLMLANSQCSPLNMLKNVKYSSASLWYLRDILVYFFLRQNSLSCVNLGLVIQYLKRQHWH